METTTRGSGILFHITSLPSAHGIGDFGPAAYRFADFLVRTRQTFWQILPMNPTDPMCGNSPYFSSSTFAMSPLFISIDDLLDDGLISATDMEGLPEFIPARIDYDGVVAYKGNLLEKAYRQFRKGLDDEAYEKFCIAHSGWLDDFALFTALKTAFNGDVWNKWPEALRDRRPEALKKAREDLEESVEKEKFFQYLLFKQWFSLKSYCNQKSIKIVGDLPIYVSYDSADVWVNPHIFKLDRERAPYAVSGVPPDYFSETGQLWSNPVYRWDILKETGYEWWIRRMAHTFDCFDMVRIDHFRGLVKYWEVQAYEETAMNGEWKEVPTHDFFDTMIKHLPHFPVIAEDLGYITDDVREVMAHFRFPGMKVLLFAFGDDDPMHPFLPHTYPKNCIAYTGTHDNNTLIGWFRNEISPQERERIFRYLYREEPVNEIHWEIIRLAMMSVADIAIIPMQDILGLGEDARMNQPATTSGNWRWRLLSEQITPDIERKLSGMTRTYGRA
ncbi:MAG: 4-alpha-glucanotransferase [Proteobacteria bacterium]|nr:4-alpha-glucanotransferase [Pseudomonadota bacterium]